MESHYQFVKGLRAIRDYRDEAVSDQDLAAILEAARWTGSSKNRQDWQFLVVNDKNELMELAKFGSYTQPVKDSAVTVVLVQQPKGNMFDIGRAAQNIMLAAKAVGVASCPITLHHTEKAGMYLGIADGAVARYAVALGYPTPDAKPRRVGGRKSLKEVVKTVD